MNKWMKIAYNEAITGMNSNEGGPFGAVIVKDGEVIASSHNRVLLSKDPTSHAEINAIRKATQILDDFDLSGCVLYTTCQPCPMCLGAIFWARIDTVYYGATKEDAARGGFDDKRFYEMINGQNSDVNLLQINAKENALLFEKWNKKSDSKLY